MRRLIQLMLFTAIVAVTSAAVGQNGPYQYYPLSPCRVVDTRGATGTNGGPYLTTTTRNFIIKGNCGVPSTAKAVSLNVTVTNGTNYSWLTIWPSNVAKPFVSMINFEPADPALANGVIVGLAPTTPDLSVANAVGIVHTIIDVTGYFQ